MLSRRAFPPCGADPGPHLMHDSLGPPESTIQTEFAQYERNISKLKVKIVVKCKILLNSLLSLTLLCKS